MDTISGNELFQKLKQLREEKGVALQDIARKYRIQVRYLEAIEQGKLQELPAVYDHLFFRSYLKALALDEEEYIEQFYRLRNQSRAQQPDPLLTRPQTDQKTGKWARILDYKSILKSKNVFVFIPFIIILIILIFLLSSTESIQTEATVPVKEIDVQSIAASLQPPAPVDTVDKVQLDEKKLNLLIYGLRSTWFRIVRDKHDTAEYMLKRGKRMTTNAAKTFEFIIGRADGLQFTLDDKPAQQVSSDSLIVSYLLIDSSGIAARRLKQLKTPLVADSTADSTHEIN
jgi:transcriptional regulator with XRE-family HTH domain